MGVGVLPRPEQSRLATETAHVFTGQVTLPVDPPPGQERLEYVHAFHDHTPYALA